MEFFTEPDNFNGILEDILGPVSLARINTGWTNFVFDVERARSPAPPFVGTLRSGEPGAGGGRNYIARFPRGECFSRAMFTDVEAVRFLRQVTDIKTTDVNLYYDKGRPFSLHTKIPGRVLSSFNLDELPAAVADSLAKSIAEFFVKLHSVRAPKSFQRPLSSFLREVMGEVPLYKDYTDIELLEKAEKERRVVPVHGDLNVGNIIVNDGFEIVAFIDFAFFSVSVPETDLARMTCRISRELFEKITGYYEKFSGYRFDKTLLTQQTKMWDDIERYYIEYMSQVMPDIVVL